MHILPTFRRSTLAVLSVILIGICKVPSVSGQSFSAAEVQALQKLRPLVTDTLYRDYMKNDWYLMFWLRGSDLDIKKTETKLRNAHKWRKDNNIDALITQDYSKIEKDLQYYLNAHDREGRPILTLLFGTWNPRKLMLAGQRDQYLQYEYRMNEFAGEKARATFNTTAGMRVTRDVPDWIIVSDMNGYTLRQHGCLACIPAYLTYVNSWELYYPDMASIYMINTPKIFESLIQVIRSALSEKRNKSMKVYGANKIEWTEALHEFIEPEQLQKAFGGAKSAN